MKKPWLFILIVLVFSAPAWAQKIEIKEVEPFVYVSVVHTGPYAEMTDAIGLLMQSMRGQNIIPAGSMISIYHNSPDDVEESALNWEVGFPTTEQVMVQSPLQKKPWPHTQVAATIHQGSYDTTGDTILTLFEWIENHGYTPAGPILATYLNMPGSGTPESQLKTDIWVPVKK